MSKCDSCVGNVFCELHEQDVCAAGVYNYCIAHGYRWYKEEKPMERQIKIVPTEELAKALGFGDGARVSYQFDGAKFYVKIVTLGGKDFVQVYKTISDRPVLLLEAKAVMMIDYGNDPRANLAQEVARDG